MVTRNCAQHAYRLRPSAETNAIFKFCLAFAQRKTGVIIHAVCVMSTHYHIILTDVHGVLPHFTRELDRTLAKVLNQAQKQWGALWSNDEPHYLELAEDDDVVRKLAYLVANPTRAGAVRSPREWPGLLLCASHERREEVVERPRHYFGARSRCPGRLTLTIEPPPILELAGRLGSHVEMLVRAARRELHERGLPFIGANGVLKRSYLRRARALDRRRGIVPRVAARSMYVRRVWLDAHREFRRAYRYALERWTAGHRHTEFPAGTWWMAIFHKARRLLPSPLTDDRTQSRAPSIEQILVVRARN
jgi:hypothetical protein